MLTKVKMQYKKHYVTVKAIDNVIFITAHTWRSRRWSVKKIKCEANKIGVKVIKIHNAQYYVEYDNIKRLHSRLMPAIKKCNVLRSEQQRRKTMKN